MESTSYSLRLAGALALAVTLLLAPAMALPTGAQDETGELQDPRYPVSIHLGTCDEWEEQPVFELSEAALPGIDSEAEDFAVIGPDDVIPVMISDTTLDTTYDQFSGDDSHILAVHQSREEIGTLVACGPVGGLIEGDRMTFGLGPINDSGITGVAIFQSGEEGLLVRTHLLVSVEQAMEQTGAQATPVANGTPAAVASVEAESGEEEGTPAEVSEQAAVTVELFDIGYEPLEFTIEANADVPVALSNIGESMHNFSIDELDISVDVGPGQTQGVTINAEPGEYTFYCNVAGHRESGMEGTLYVAEE